MGGSSALTQNCHLPFLTQSKLELDTLMIQYLPIKSLRYADSVLHIIDSLRLEECTQSFWIKYNRAEILEHYTKYKDALDVYYSILSVSKLEENPTMIASCNLSIARCMEFIGRKVDCKRHLDIAYDIIAENKLEELLPFYYVRLTSYFRIFDTKDSARKVVKHAMHWSDYFGVSRYSPDAYLLAGFLEENRDSSIYFLKIAMHYFLGYKNYNGVCYMVRAINKKYNSQENYKLSNQWLDSLGYYLNFLTEFNPANHFILAEYYTERAVKFENANRFDSSSYYYKLVGFHKEQQFQNVNHDEVTQAEIDYYLKAEKDRTIELENKAKLQRIALVLLLMGLTIVSSLFYSNNLKRRQIEHQQDYIVKQNFELSNSLSRQNILLSEIHHRVKNNLQLVISLLTLHYNKVKNNSEYQYLEEISNKIRSIALIHEQLYNTGEFEKIELKVYIRQLLEHYLTLHTSTTQFEYNIQAFEEIHLNLETVIPIGIICTELISNSLKYARRPDVVLKMNFELAKLDNKYKMKYYDNGIRRSNEKIREGHGGMGTMLIESMVRQLQAQSSPIVEGTAVFNIIFQEKVISAV
ncbi:MAG TPA: sensor histidine kinase [Saprospiraceae bacterium]|nr:sensor histidine kinase [Saprospiraceae bacterium]